ncbi:putative oxidoreductase YrbE [Orchesella cincta]|uniref:Putative oxidoreductase YrbE n=1 Tax=Orchesella cincta TaxID=48709 RepID=A0A1D2MNA5_ORCCI|nr:putative oxidoreductase YrbE [Orchesella cincta]
MTPTPTPTPAATISNTTANNPETPSGPPKEDYKYHDFLKLLRPSGTNEKVTVALFGVGRAGTIHLGNLLGNTRIILKYVVEERFERREEIENMIGGSSSSAIQFVGADQTDAVLGDKGLQAVVITTPTFAHKELVLKALDYGKAVFCEKPIADNNEDIKKCYQKAQDAGLPLLCAFNRRFDPSFSTLAKKVHAGELGKVHMVKTCARDSPLPSMEYLKISNGIFHDCAVHDIDLVCWTLGQFPTRVFSTATAHRKEIADIDDFDTVAIQMTFPEGTMALIDLSRFAVYGYDQRIEVFGPGGMLQCNNQSSVTLQSYKSDGVQDQPIWYSFASRYDDAYKRQLDHFINVVQGKEELIITAKQTLACCRVASAAEKSARTGLPVDIKYDD